MRETGRKADEYRKNARRGAGRAGAARAGARARHESRPLFHRDRREAREPRAAQLADVPRQLRGVGLQPARPDQPGQRLRPAPGLDLLDQRRRGAPVPRHRQRRHDVHHHAAEPGGGARRRDRRGALALQARDPRGAVAGPPDQPGRRAVGRQHLRHHDRLPSRRAQRRDPARRSGAPRPTVGRTATT